MNELKELINELNKASELYYNGKESFLTDKEFDEKIKYLKELEQKNKIIYSNSPTINVGSKVLSSLNKVQIKDKPMLSLNKVHSSQEIVSFAESNEVVGSVKCDGLSVRLIYKNTDLVSANTRGNGYEGGDITEHIKHFLNVPIKIEKTGTYIIDGEAIIYDSDFNLINKNNEFKNNRNTASGALALLDMSIVQKRRLSFIGWDIISGGNSNYYYENLNEAKKLGFTIVPKILTNKCKEKDFDKFNSQLLNEAKELGIPCDGIVWRLNNNLIGENKGQTSHHFLNAVAWKPKNEEYETELLDIEWSMSRTGTLTPVAIFEPIDIEGSTVSRANLSNVSVMWDTLGKCPESHQKIYVSKRNQIIPKIERAEKNDIPHDHILSNGQVPMFCPVCGGDVKLVSDFDSITAICTNSLCPGKLVNVIDHYCDRAKGLDIRGLSKKTIEQLIEWGWIESPYDLYFLKGHRDEWINKQGFGVTSVTKILDAIEKSKTCRLENYISALGIPLVGLTIAKEIVKYYETWDDFREAIGGRWSDLYGFGISIETSLNKYDYTMADRIAEMLNFIIPEEDNEIDKNNLPFINKTFVITGRLQLIQNREKLINIVEKNGGKVTNSVSRNTSILINNDINSNSAKNRKAKELNIPIITEKEFLNQCVIKE